MPSHLPVSVQMVFRVGAEMDAVGVTTMSKNSMAEVEEFKLKFSIRQNALSKVIGSKKNVKRLDFLRPTLSRRGPQISVIWERG